MLRLLYQLPICLYELPVRQFNTDTLTRIFAVFTIAMGVIITYVTSTVQYVSRKNHESLGCV